MIPRSFRTRLMFLTFLVLAPTGALVLIANIQRMETEKEKIRREAVCAAKLAAASQEHYVRQARQLLETMTRFPFLVMLKDPGLGRTGMANLKLISPDYADFGLIERDGTVFCHTLGTNFSGEIVPTAFTQKVLDQPGFSMSDLHPGPISREATLQFAYPVFETNRNVARLMYASIRVPLLSTALVDIPLPPGGVVTVMDRAGNIVAQQPAPENSVGRRVPAFSLIQKALAKTSDSFESDNGGVKHVCAVSAVKDGKSPLLLVQVAVPQKTLFAEPDARFGASFIGMLLISALVLSVAWLFSERALLNPVRAMLNATERLIKGELTARTGIAKPRSELHVLASRFDVMAETLASRQEQLELANREITRNNAELEERVQARTEELQVLNNELEAFSYSVSHDLRAPLRHVNGFAQLLAGDETLESNSSAQRYLGLITKAAEDMGTLIDDLLSFSKMARQSMAVGTVHSEEIVKAIVHQIDGQEGERQIVWEIRSLPTVQGDAAMLRQVWSNLISNAVKYTRGQEPARIEIFSFQDQDETIFVIADNGVGFDMAYADKLFGVFQRLHREEEFPGTGIGLANVRRIISRHQGRTWAEAELNKGAKFFFSLPQPRDRKP